ncbi:caspase family protein [Streptomyces sp. 4N509B]|uniref:caspase family protein n=1 Tax=Streptomyces sp. 4N509B TaxID=3457413 RepID=UPI003FD609CF
MAVPDPRTSRAVVVGIGDYAHDDLATMPATAAGADRLAGLLRNPSVWGLPQDHVTVLGADASGARILTAVRDAAVATEDTLLVYFAGHGLRDPAGHLYLALTDADPDYPQLGTLPYVQLRDLIRQSGHRARHRVTVLDCCYSGIAGGMSPTTAPSRDELAHALDERADANGNDPNGARANGAEDRYGDCVLTSAPAESRSFVRPGATFPEFTGELITTLEAGITGAGSLISLEGAWLRVRDRMRSRGSPEPQHFAQNNATRHIHFLNRATTSDPGPGPDQNPDPGPGPEPGPGTSAAHLAALAAAERAAREVADAYGRMSLLAEVASATATVDPDKARGLADEVVAAGRDTTDATKRALLLARTATGLVALDPPRSRQLLDEAETTIQALADPQTKVTALAKLADALSATHRDRAIWLVEEAEEVVHSLPVSYEKSSLLLRLSYCGVFDDTPEWRRRMEDEAENLWNAAKRSRELDEASRRSSRDEVRANEARTIPHQEQRVEKLVGIAKDLVEHKHYHQALELLEEAEETVQQVRPHKGRALGELTYALRFDVGWAARTSPDRVIDLLARVQRTIDSLPAPDYARDDRLEHVAMALTDVAWHLSRTDPRRAVDLVRQAQGIAPHITEGRRRKLGDFVARALVGVGKEIASADAEHAVELAHEAWDIVSSQSDAGLMKDWTSRDVVVVLAQAGGHLAGTNPEWAEELTREAESLARRLPESERTRGLTAVAEGLARAGQEVAGTRPDRVDAFVRESERVVLGLPPQDAMWPLSAIAQALAAAGTSVVGTDPERAASYAREAERFVRKSAADAERKDRDLTRIMMLHVEIVRHRPSHAERAQRTAERLTDDERRTWILLHLVKALAPADPEHAQRIAETITDAGCRAHALVAVSHAWAADR